MLFICILGDECTNWLYLSLDFYVWENDPKFWFLKVVLLRFWFKCTLLFSILLISTDYDTAGEFCHVASKLDLLVVFLFFRRRAFVVFNKGKLNIFKWVKPDPPFKMKISFCSRTSDYRLFPILTFEFCICNNFFSFSIWFLSFWSLIILSFNWFTSFLCFCFVYCISTSWVYINPW